jgi:hypothetical protein
MNLDFEATRFTAQVLDYDQESMQCHNQSKNLTSIEWGLGIHGEQERQCCVVHVDICFRNLWSVLLCATLLCSIMSSTLLSKFQPNELKDIEDILGRGSSSNLKTNLTTNLLKKLQQISGNLICVFQNPNTICRSKYLWLLENNCPPTCC